MNQVDALVVGIGMILALVLVWMAHARADMAREERAELRRRLDALEQRKEGR